MWQILRSSLSVGLITAFISIGIMGLAHAAFDGALYLETNDPLKAVAIVRLDMKTGKHRIEVNGVDGRRANKRIVFVQSCGNRGTGDQLAITDEDGFITKASPCENDRITTNLHSSAISPNGAYVAAVDAEIKLSSPKGTSALRKWAAKRTSGVRVYTAKGDLVNTFIGYQAPVWTHGGFLLMAGTGQKGEADYGIYKVSANYKSVRRIDDGRLNGAIWSVAASPVSDKIAFVFNSQLWEMDIASGAPKRKLAYQYPIAALTYAPNGRDIAFIVDDPLREKINRGNRSLYLIHVFDGQNVSDVGVNFVPGGPLSWTAN